LPLPAVIADVVQRDDARQLPTSLAKAPMSW
jgi:hypothetical protein